MRPLFLLAWSACTSMLCAQTPVTHDVVVYGDSAAAVAAAIQAKRQGLDVVLVNSTDFLGGLSELHEDRLHANRAMGCVGGGEADGHQ